MPMTREANLYHNLVTNEDKEFISSVAAYCSGLKP